MVEEGEEWGGAGREGRRVAVVTEGVTVGRVLSLCLFLSLDGWGAWLGAWWGARSPSLSGVLRASMISS